MASVIQVLLAVAFLAASYGAHRYGDRAQRAAEERVAAQGYDTGLLAKHHVRFAESFGEAVLPVALAVCLTVLAWLDLAGGQVGRIASLVFQSMLLLGGGVVTASQVFPERAVEAAFRRSGDRALDGIDVRGFVAAARDAFPVWLRILIPVRFVLVTLGSWW